MLSSTPGDSRKRCVRSPLVFPSIRPLPTADTTYHLTVLKPFASSFLTMFFGLAILGLRKIVTPRLSLSRLPQSSPIRAYFLRSRAYAVASNVSKLLILLGCAYGPPSLTTKRSPPFYNTRTSSDSTMPTNGQSVVPAQTIRRLGCTSNTAQRWRRALETLSRLSRKTLLLFSRSL